MLWCVSTWQLRPLSQVCDLDFLCADEWSLELGWRVCGQIFVSGGYGWLTSRESIHRSRSVPPWTCRNHIKPITTAAVCCLSTFHHVFYLASNKNEEHNYSKRRTCSLNCLLQAISTHPAKLKNKTWKQKWEATLENNRGKHWWGATLGSNAGKQNWKWE